jgi:hypothetical protein
MKKVTIQELIDYLQEIKDIVSNLPKQEHQSDNDRIAEICRICDHAIIEWKIEKRLKNET